MIFEWMIVCKKYKTYLKLPELINWQNDLWKVYKFLNNYYGENLYFISNKYPEFEQIIKKEKYKNFDKEFCDLNSYDEEDLDYIDIIQHTLLNGVWVLSKSIQEEKDKRYNELLKTDIGKV